MPVEFTTEELNLFSKIGSRGGKRSWRPANRAFRLKQLHEARLAKSRKAANEKKKKL